MPEAVGQPGDGHGPVGPGGEGHLPGRDVAGRDAVDVPDVDAVLGAKDPAAVERWLPAVTRYVNYFSPEIRGREHLPASGPVLVVGNHSNLFYMPDVWAVGLELVRRRGSTIRPTCSPTTCCSRCPGSAPRCAASGASPPRAPRRDGPSTGARPSSCTREATGRRAARGPGVTSSTSVDTAASSRVALQAGVRWSPWSPSAPTTRWSWSQRRAPGRPARTGPALRIDVFPIVLTSLGLATVLTPPLPMPSAMTIEFLPPLDWSRFGPVRPTTRASSPPATTRSRRPPVRSRPAPRRAAAPVARGVVEPPAAGAAPGGGPRGPSDVGAGPGHRPRSAPVRRGQGVAGPPAMIRSTSVTASGTAAATAGLSPTPWPKSSPSIPTTTTRPGARPTARARRTTPARPMPWVLVGAPGAVPRPRRRRGRSTRTVPAGGPRAHGVDDDGQVGAVPARRAGRAARRRARCRRPPRAARPTAGAATAAARRRRRGGTRCRCPATTTVGGRRPAGRSRRSTVTSRKCAAHEMHGSWLRTACSQRHVSSSSARSSPSCDHVRAGRPRW